MRSRTRRRLGFLVFLTLTVVAVIVALWHYHQMIVGVYDGASTAVYRRMLMPFGEGQGDGLGLRPVRIALFHSDHSARALGPEAQGLEELVRRWERALGHQRFAHRRIHRLTDERDLDDFNVLILPATVAMSDAEISSVQRFMRRGNGVLMTWATGTRDEDGAWRRFSFLEQVAGLELAGSVPGPSDQLAHVLLSPRAPIAAGIAPGFVLTLHRYDDPISARVREPRTSAAGTWLEHDRLRVHRIDSTETQESRTVLAHGDYLGGRFVWMGFTIASGTETSEQREGFDLLLRNAIAWVGRQAIAYKPNWPNDVQSAFSLGVHTRGATPPDERLLALLEHYRVPITTYLTPETLADQPDLVNHLARRGDIGLQAAPSALSGEAPAPPSIEQLRTLHRRLRDLDHGVPGFRLPGAELPQTWMDALLRGGFTSIASARHDHLMPAVVRTYRPLPVLSRRRELWLMPETPIDRREGDGRRRATLRSLFSVVHDLGGYYGIVLDMDAVDVSMLQEVDDLLAAVRRERVWISSTSDIVRFYQVWGHIKVSSDYPTPNRTAIQVSNTGTEAVTDLTIFIRMDRALTSIDLSPTTLGTPPVDPVSDDGVVWRFRIPRIPAGKNYLYHLYRG